MTVAGPLGILLLIVLVARRPTAVVAWTLATGPARACVELSHNRCAVSVLPTGICGWCVSPSPATNNSSALGNCNCNLEVRTEAPAVRPHSRNPRLESPPCALGKERRSFIWYASATSQSSSDLLDEEMTAVRPIAHGHAQVRGLFFLPRSAGGHPASHKSQPHVHSTFRGVIKTDCAPDMYTYKRCLLLPIFP